MACGGFFSDSPYTEFVSPHAVLSDEFHTVQIDFVCCEAAIAHIEDDPDVDFFVECEIKSVVVQLGSVASAALFECESCFIFGVFNQLFE